MAKIHKKKTIILQLHHQFRDDTTQFVSQKEFAFPTPWDMERGWIEEAQADYPLPLGAIWMICDEHSDRFVKGLAHKQEG